MADGTAAINQNFTAYAGRASYPVFTVRDAAGGIIPINDVQEIEWDASRDATSPAVLVKTKTGGGIQFVTDGTDGQFRVNISPSDTQNLSGFYMHEAEIIDSFGNPTTVTLGRWEVGRSPAWSYSGDPANSERDAVRFWLGDTNASNPQIMDPEIDYALTQFTNPMLAAAKCARNLQAQFARKPNKRVGDLSISYGDIAKAYAALAADLEATGITFGVRPYSGGISWSDRCKVSSNLDRVRPPFVINQFNNYSGINNTSEFGWDTAPVQ